MSLFIVFGFSPTFAGYYNFRALLTGERAVGMGGAYTALSNTAEGGYYNPAGLAFVDRPTLSGAGNFYSIVRGTRKDAIQLDGGIKSIDQNSFTSIPQNASFTKRVHLPWENQDEEAKNAMAFSVVVMEQLDVAGRIDFPVTGGNVTASRSISDQTLYAGPSFARKVNDHFSWGVSGFYVLRQVSTTVFLLEDTASSYVQAYLDRHALIGNVVGMGGVRYSPHENVWLGLSYQTPSLEVHSDGRRMFSAAQQDRTTNTFGQGLDDKPHVHPIDQIPQHLALGVAYEKPSRWAIAADAIGYLGSKFKEFRGSTDSPIDQKNIVNFSVGGEYYVTEQVPLRAGVFSNFSAAPDIQAGVAGQSDQVDHIGFSLTGGIEQKNTSINLGTVITFGSGSGVDNLGNKISVDSTSYSAVLAGSYKF